MDGSFGYNGFFTSPPPAIVACLAAVAAVEQPRQIVEIGTAQGGLTALLVDTWPKAAVHSFDVHPCLRKDDLKARGATLHLADIFKKGGLTMATRLIAAAGRTLVLCDGGAKAREFNTFAKWLKPGDLIMAHDYANPACPGWTWSEIVDADVAETVVTCRLVPFMQDVMGQAAWLSYRRPG